MDGWGVCFSVCVGCFSLSSCVLPLFVSLFHVCPFLSFYNTEGEGSGYNCGFVAIGKEEREKGGAGVAVLLLPVGNNHPVAQDGIDSRSRAQVTVDGGSCGMWWASSQGLTTGWRSVP